MARVRNSVLVRATHNLRNDVEVEERWWRTHHPLQRAAAPGIPWGAIALPHRNDDVVDENDRGDAEHVRADSFDGVDGREAGVVVGHAAGHSLQPLPVHGHEGDLRTDEGEPEVPLAQPLVQHPAGRLGEPVIDAREDRVHAAAVQHIVQVGGNEVGV